MEDYRKTPIKTLAPNNLRSNWEAVTTTHLIEMMMENQKSIGELKASVENIMRQTKDHGRKMDRVQYRVNFIVTPLLIAIAVLGFFLDNFWDDIRKISELLTTR